ncbi:sensor histidine kinase [Anditalea andensis]|uniref:Signal transduction histidine kinase internal region domain-containing protein n=1 Tax=Anditalea andensis TaxID=1048983 RepID=A0A074LDP0_9BACT|nr:histidine kinase [Anditalea andensis]KEO71912.1 hypothetical protein EL17_20565 [Anditalea andensis]
MYKIKNANYIFWAFIFGVIFLQLFTSKEFSLVLSFIYTIVITAVLKFYLDFILSRLIESFFISKYGKRFIAYCIGISTLVAVILTAIGYYLFYMLLPYSIFTMLLEDMVTIFFGMLTFTILFSGLVFGFEILKKNLEIEKRDQIMKNTVLELEVDHLRTQLSPHFTFNILNNLQFLIRKDKDEALDLLSRYSSILRYYVYESKNKWIRLNDEISFLKHYFHLEKGRSGEDLQIDCSWEIPETQLVIIPFVLSTFVENAFKHVSCYTEQPNFIHLDISVYEGNELKFYIENSFDEKASKNSVKGMGLDNAKKRLELSYHENYKLDISAIDGIYQVHLQIKLQSI